MHLSQQILNEAARQCGFSSVALVPARVLAEYKPHEEAIRQGIVNDPFSLMPGAQSILVAAMPFHWFSKWPEGCAEVSAYYFQSQIAHAGIAALARRLEALGVSVCQEQRLPIKLLGREAGLGELGNNGLLQNAVWGSCFTMRILLTDIDSPLPTDRLSLNACGNCTFCVRACPTGALQGDGRIDPQKCLRTYMLQGSIVPEPLREKMGTRLLGCEICQRVCPHNAALPEVSPLWGVDFSIENLLRATRASLAPVAVAIGANEARPQRVLAQAIIVAGNTGDTRYLPLLEPLRGHERASVAEHAKWAIKKIRSTKHATN